MKAFLNLINSPLKRGLPSRTTAMSAAMRLHPQRGQAGFIQGVLLFGIALLAVVIAAFSFSNRGSSNSTATEEAKVYASTIISHGAALKDAVQRFKADRGDLVYMHFLSADTNGNALFNTTDNFIAPLTVQPKAYTTAPNNTVTTTKNGPYYYVKGTVAGVPARIATTGPLQKATCQRLNLTLHGSLFAGEPPAATTGADAAFAPTTGTTTAPTSATKQMTSTTPDAIAIPAFTNITNLSEGCVQAAGGGYYFFKILDTDFTSGNN